ncbi:uncharacterized protein BXZ73DRAFT_84885, partial [Epithele typhae]|uniref:uncharacterized protein n=1 Tax=Epithele typhae TaxID=378194 RepID=UPI00200863B1
MVRRRPDAPEGYQDESHKLKRPPFFLRVCSLLLLLAISTQAYRISVRARSPVPPRARFPPRDFYTKRYRRGNRSGKPGSKSGEILSESGETLSKSGETLSKSGETLSKSGESGGKSEHACSFATQSDHYKSALVAFISSHLPYLSSPTAGSIATRATGTSTTAFSPSGQTEPLSRAEEEEEGDPTSERGRFPAGLDDGSPKAPGSSGSGSGRPSPSHRGSVVSHHSDLPGIQSPCQEVVISAPEAPVQDELRASQSSSHGIESSRNRGSGG